MPSEQILWDTFLATETFVFYIRFLQNSIQRTTNNVPNMSGVQFLAQANCLFQTLLQPSSEAHPVCYPKSTLSSYCPYSKFSGTVRVLRMRICEVLMLCLYRDNLHFIWGTIMTESIMEAICRRTPHTKILQCITLSLPSSTALLLCHQLFLLPFDVSASFSSHLHGGEKLTSWCHPVLYT